MKRFFLMCVAMLASGTTAFGYTNLLENGANQAITNGWDAVDNMMVGDATSGNTLSIVAGGSLTNVDAYVGAQAGASDNTATVSGTGAEWVNTGTLRVGSGGAGNSLTVQSNGWVYVGDTVLPSGAAGGLIVASASGAELVVGGNGARVDVEQGLYVGRGLSSSGTVTVDSGGIMTADSVEMGASGTFNLYGSLTVNEAFNAGLSSFNWADGGTLTVGGALTFNDVLGGSNKTLNMDGGSWNRGADLGVDGAGNTLAILHGGGVTNDDAYVVGSSNAVVVSGTGSSWQNNGTLNITNSGNSVTVESGGKVVADSVKVTDGNYFNLNDSGTLATTGAFDANQVGLNWNAGGTLSVGGTLSLDTFGGSNRVLEVVAGGVWDTTAGDLNLTGTGNRLSITNGGRVLSASAFVGNSSADVDNTVRVDGAGSEWNLTGSLFVNASNTLELTSAGLVSVGGNLVVSNATVAGNGTIELVGGVSSLLSIYGTNSQISTDLLINGGGGATAFTEAELLVSGSLSSRFVNFDRLSLTNSLLSGTGTVDGFANINLVSGRIAPIGELTIDGAFEATDTTLEVVAGADVLRVMNSGAVNVSGLEATVRITNSTVTAAFNEEIMSSADGFTAAGFASTNIVEHFLLYDFALANDVSTVSVVAEAAVDGEIGASLAYGRIQGVRAGFYAMQNGLFVRTKQLRRNVVATDLPLSQEAYLMSSTNAPTGARGPGERNTIFGMHFWIDHFSGQGDYDTMGNSQGFSLDNNGTSFGFDRIFGEDLVVGINYTYARSTAAVIGDDRVKTETYWLGLYGEWAGKNDYYLEGLLALGWSDYDTVRRDVGYTGTGSFGGSDFGGHLEAGKYFHTRHWAVAPYVGLGYLGVKSDAYTESEENGGTMAVDEQSVASLESALGMKLRNRFDTRSGRFQTVGYAEWAYDYINDDIGSSLSDGSLSVRTARIAPGASVLNAGVGLSWICTDYLEVGLGYDGRFNENYEEHTGSIMLDVRF